jgi:hypothetical protein
MPNGNLPMRNDQKLETGNGKECGAGRNGEPQCAENWRWQRNPIHEELECMMMAKKRKAASFTKIQIISNSFVNLS